MPAISYAWNPFQERVDCHVANEIIKTATDIGRMEFVPRAAPFFGRNFTLYQQGNPTPLKLGVDYVFGHMFKGFVHEYNRNAFGSVIPLRDFGSAVLSANYDTIGAPFVLDDAAFATLVGNIASGPRQANWEDLVGVPTAWPVDPHEHPAAQTYDYLEMMDAMTSLILAITNTNNNSPSLQSVLEEHLQAALPAAHTAAKADVGLALTPNMGAAVNSDLTGNSANLLVTVAVLKEAIKQNNAGTLPLS